MPYSDPQKRRERQAQYRQTPEGRAASARSHARFIAKRRDRPEPGIQINPAPLAQVLTHWRTQ